MNRLRGSEFAIFIALVFLNIQSLLGEPTNNTAGKSEKFQNATEEIKLIFYTRLPESKISAKIFSLKEVDKLLNFIDSKKSFVLYIHGYEENSDSESIQTVVSAYLQRGSDNIVVVDWSTYAYGNYLKIALDVKFVSKYVATALQKLVTAGLNVGTLHVIGHSLGAHIAGFIGKYIDFVIPRISALDPANPLFYQFGAEHINATSAKQVDVIHTDGGILSYGAWPVTGTIDFYANGGFGPQPGCPFFSIPLTNRSYCSHWRSWRYYAESVTNEKAFPALQCDSYWQFYFGLCKENPISYFGYKVPADATGVYYFNTNAEPPFSKGLKGIYKE